jgi:thiamine-monophosphate kinase
MARTVADMGEIELVTAIMEVLADAPDGSSVRVGPGNDAAVLSCAGDVVLTTDSQHETVHFETRWMDARQLGLRAIAINASDLGAMGARPTGFLVALALPKATEVDWVLGLAEGLRDGARRYDGSIIGGDVAAVEGAISINVTAAGERAPGLRAGRDGARSGDELWVTGWLGRAAAGRQLLQSVSVELGDDALACVRAFVDPAPPVRFGVELVEAELVAAMMDISDGLAIDLHRLCRASGVGARLEATRLFDDPTLAAAAQRHGLDRRDCVLGGGEDYELLCAVRADAAGDFQRAAKRHDVAARSIGEVVAPGEGITLLEDGGAESLESSGWDHFS